VIYIDEALALWRQQVMHGTHRTYPSFKAVNVPEYVPQACNHVKARGRLGIDLRISETASGRNMIAQLFGTDVPYLGGSRGGRDHFRAGLDQHNILNSALLGNSQRAYSISRANIQKRLAGWRNPRNDDLLYTAQVGSATLAEVSVVRRQAIVSRDWIVKIPAGIHEIVLDVGSDSMCPRLPRSIMHQSNFARYPSRYRASSRHESNLCGGLCPD